VQQDHARAAGVLRVPYPGTSCPSCQQKSAPQVATNQQHASQEFLLGILPCTVLYSPHHGWILVQYLRQHDLCLGGRPQDGRLRSSGDASRIVPDVSRIVRDASRIVRGRLRSRRTAAHWPVFAGIITGHSHDAILEWPLKARRCYKGEAMPQEVRYGLKWGPDYRLCI